MKTVKITKQKKVSASTIYKVLYILPLAMILYALLTTTPRELIKGLEIICRSNDILLTDYLLIAGIGPTFINAALVLLINLWLIRRLDLKPNGIIIAALFLLTGFSFMGKNIFNIWPFYLGGYLYSKYHGISYKNVVIINMFSTTFSPLTSLIGISMSDSVIEGIMIMAIVGGFVGFIMPTVSSHMLTFHAGYNLYNMGAAAGFVGMIVYALLEQSDVIVKSNDLVLQTNHPGIIIFLIIYCIALVAIGYCINEKTFKGYKHILSHSGRLITDIIKQDGFGLSLVNMGVLGILSILFVVLMGGVFNGPTIAAMMTVMGFGAFGKHPKNVWPVVMGVVVGWQFFGIETSVTIIIISALFGTTLAPVAGEYGVLWGLVAGILHAAFVQNIGSLHGGLVLYNNGFSGGIIAAILVPVIDAFKKENRRET